MKSWTGSLAYRFASIALIPFVILSFSVTAPALASPSSAAVSALDSQSVFNHPLASQIDTDAFMRQDARTHLWVVKNGTSTTKVNFNASDQNKLYKLQETRNGETITIRYLYDNNFKIVTLLLSVTDQGELVQYTHYYRYLLGENNSLTLILEEGWVQDSLLLPSKLYDYYNDGIGVRLFDKAGSLLKLETSNGDYKKFFYAKNGRLLTIQSVDALGKISFIDQLKLH